MSYAKQYVEQIIQTFSVFGGTENAGHQRQIWQEFLSVARIYTKVDWKLSAKLAERHHAEPRACFANARRVARTHKRLQYCEGIACGIIPTTHAWLIDPATLVVVDPTWVMLPPPLPATGDYCGIGLDRPIPRQSDFEPTWLPLIVKRLGLQEAR